MARKNDRPRIMPMNPTRRIFVAVMALVALTASCATDQRGGATPGAFVAIPGVTGPALPLARPGDVGMSAEGIAQITTAMQALVDDGRLPGVMTIIARAGKIVHWEAVGMRDIESGDPLEPDDMFPIHSMTKPITSTAIMMLVESGDVALDDPVSRFIPAFSGLAVLEKDGSRTPVARPMRVQHLLTHTGGLTYGMWSNTPVDQMYLSEGLFESRSAEDFVMKVAGFPLLAHPGDQWHYSVSADILGYIVAIASGQPLEQFLHRYIFAPLNMDDTAFQVPAEKRHRLMTHYSASGEGFQVVDSAQVGAYLRIPSGGGGLVSTASDYIRFAQMLLQEGELDGVRILQPETVRAMRANQLPDGLTLASLGAPDYGFGFGFAVLVNENATLDADHNGKFGWSGLANTFFWIDPEAELIAMVWAQMNPFGIHDLDKQFQTLVYEAMEEPRQ